MQLKVSLEDWTGGRTPAGLDWYEDAAPDSIVVGLENVMRYPFLFAELLRRGYSDDDLLKIAGQNHLRAMRQTGGGGTSKIRNRAYHRGIEIELK
jgi:membrane dipeptidase